MGRNSVDLTEFSLTFFYSSTIGATHWNNDSKIT